MIALDAIVFDFIEHNYFTMTLFVGLLKIIAKMTPGARDDKIVELFGAWIGGLRRTKINNTIKSPIIGLFILLLSAPCLAQTEFDIGISTSHGVVDKQQAIVDIAYSEGNKKISGQWRYTETEGQRIEEKGLVRAEYDKTLDEKWVIWNYEQAGYDHAREIQVENFIGSGPKYYFVKTETTSASFSAGALHHYIDYDDGTSEALCRYSIRPKLRTDRDGWSLEAWAFYQPAVEDFDNYILHGRASLRYAITDEVGLKGALESEYRSVSIGEKNNLTTSFSMSWRF